MAKAGASYHDKNRVRELYRQGDEPALIAQKLSLLPQHVRAICKQIDAGTLRTSPPSTGTASKTPANSNVQAEETAPESDDDDAEEVETAPEPEPEKKSTKK